MKFFKLQFIFLLGVSKNFWKPVNRTNRAFFTSSTVNGQVLVLEKFALVEVKHEYRGVNKWVDLVAKEALAKSLSIYYCTLCFVKFFLVLRNDSSFHLQEDSIGVKYLWLIILQFMFSLFAQKKGV